MLPAMAAARRWPIHHDHCFQRVLLDAAFGGVWYHSVRARPAYRAMPRARLAAAVALAERIVMGRADLAGLNAQSLRWRAAFRSAADLSPVAVRASPGDMLTPAAVSPDRR